MSRRDYVDSQRPVDCLTVPLWRIFLSVDDSQNDPLLASPSSCLFISYSCSDTERWKTDRWWWCIWVHGNYGSCKSLSLRMGVWWTPEIEREAGKKPFDDCIQCLVVLLRCSHRRFYYILNANAVMCMDIIKHTSLPWACLQGETWLSNRATFFSLLMLTLRWAELVYRISGSGQNCVAHMRWR